MIMNNTEAPGQHDTAIRTSIPDAGAETLAVKSDTRREAEADYQSRVTHSSCHPGSLIRQGLQGNVHVFILLFCLSFVVACFILMRL